MGARSSAVAAPAVATFATTGDRRGYLPKLEPL
jgi:hypothetical protein